MLSLSFSLLAILVGTIVAIMAVMVAVLVTVAITISSVGSHLGTVEDDSKVAVLAALVIIFQFRKHILIKQSGTNQEDGHIGTLVDNLGICHDIYWRTVDKDEIVIPLEGIDSLGKTSVCNKFCWVRRYRTNWDVIQGLVLVALDDQGLKVICTLGQVIAHTGSWFAEE